MDLAGVKETFMTSVPSQDDKTKMTKPKAKGIYKLGIVLTIIGLVYGIIIIALHYGTNNNMFAGHSLVRYSANNPLPLVVASAGIIFIVGLILLFVGRPVAQPVQTAAKQ